MHLRPIPGVVSFTDTLQAAGEISEEEFPAWPVLGIALAIAGPNDLPPIQVFGEDGCMTRPTTLVSEEEEDQLIDAQAVTAGGGDQVSEDEDGAVIAPTDEQPSGTGGEVQSPIGEPVTDPPPSNKTRDAVERLTAIGNKEDSTAVVVSSPRSLGQGQAAEDNRGVDPPVPGTEGKSHDESGSIGEETANEGSRPPSPSKGKSQDKGKQRAREVTELSGEEEGTLRPDPRKKGNRGKKKKVSQAKKTAPAKKTTGEATGLKRKARPVSSNGEIVPETPLLSEVSEDELLLRAKIGRPGPKKARISEASKTARSAQKFDGVLVPGLPDTNFEGIVFDEDSVVDPSRVPQVVGAVSSVPKSY